MIKDGMEKVKNMTKAYYYNTSDNFAIKLSLKINDNKTFSGIFKVKHYGNFENGIMEGNGIFYWEDGSRWEGTFSNNKLHGEGIFYNPKTKARFNATYRNNRLMDENNLGYGSIRKNKGDRENMFRSDKERDRDRDRDSYFIYCWHCRI